MSAYNKRGFDSPTEEELFDALKIALRYCRLIAIEQNDDTYRYECPTCGNEILDPLELVISQHRGDCKMIHARRIYDKHNHEG